MLPVQVPAEEVEARPLARSTDIGPPRNAADFDSLRDCGTLPALIEAGLDGVARIRSYWRPSEEELDALNAGQPIELVVVAPQMVPVALNVVAS